MSDESEENQNRDWVEQSKHGNEDAFRHLFEAYYMMIYHFCYRLTLSRQTAQDLAQITFIKAARKISTCQSQTCFRSWLFKIASNSAKDWFRQQRRERSALEDFRDHATEPEKPSPAHERVKAALACLSPKLRQAAILIYFEEMNHREAASVMGCAEGTISWYANRARRKLKKQLEASDE